MIKKRPGEGWAAVHKVAKGRLRKPRGTHRFERDHRRRPGLAVDRGELSKDTAGLDIAIGDGAAVFGKERRPGAPLQYEEYVGAILIMRDDRLAARKFAPGPARLKRLAVRFAET